MAKTKKRYHPKKRSSHKRSGTPRRRRRSVGAMALNANSMPVKLGSVLLGYLMGAKILAPIKTAIGDKVDAKIVAGIEGLGGYYLAFKKGGKKNLIMTVIGGVLIGDAVKSAMASFGMGGIGPYGRVPVIAGTSPYGRVPVIAGRRMGYSPNGTLGAYSPSGTINRVLTGIGNSSGSGMTSNTPGSDYMN